jgi:endo-beta-N-acetylglucosaminidase D
MKANDIANDQQHADWSQHEEDISRNGQGFSNYILDQTVIQDNNMYGNGTIGHGTVWNNQADALVKADPNRFEYVTVPNYWRGTDFVP